MRRGFAVLIALAGLGACRSYDGYSPLANESGLIPAARYARYGPEQAAAVAIGRSLAQWYGGETAEARITQTIKAAEYARTVRGVVSAVPDSLGYRLTVTFQSGWRTAIVPIPDGIRPETPSLLALQPPASKCQKGDKGAEDWL